MKDRRVTNTARGKKEMLFVGESKKNAVQNY